MARSRDPRWTKVSIDERKALVIEELQRLSSGGRGVSMARFDGQSPHWMPSAQYCARLFGNWPAANQAADLEPLKRGYHRASHPPRMTE